MNDSPQFRIIEGDALTVLRTLPEESVHCCVTSPPYWGLRDYGVTGQLGLEPTPDLYVQHAVEVFREVRRVLRTEGTLWLNIGDCFATGAGAVGDRPGGGEQGARWKGFRGDHKHDAKRNADAIPTGPGTQPNRMPIPGLKSKDLVGIPWMLAFALRADGWYLRSDIVWNKPNCMPESVTDRPTKSHEYLFLLSKSERYYYNHEAIMEALQTSESENYPARARVTGRGDQGFALARGNDRGKSGGFPPSKKSGNKARVLDLPTRPNDHRGSSIPWEGNARNKRSVWTVNTTPFAGAHFAVMPEALVEPCILAGCPNGGTVYDPFTGSGTVAVVALRRGRNFIGSELSPKYVKLAYRRIVRSAPLLHAQPEGLDIGEWEGLPLFEDSRADAAPRSGGDGSIGGMEQAATGTGTDPRSLLPKILGKEGAEHIAQADGF